MLIININKSKNTKKGALAVEFGMILKLGNIANLAFICILISMFSFFLSHWENYCTGLMQFGK